MRDRRSRLGRIDLVQVENPMAVDPLLGDDENQHQRDIPLIRSHHHVLIATSRALPDRNDPTLGEVETAEVGRWNRLEVRPVVEGRGGRGLDRVHPMGERRLKLTLGELTRSEGFFAGRDQRTPPIGRSVSRIIVTDPLKLDRPTIRHILNLLGDLPGEGE